MESLWCVLSIFDINALVCKLGGSWLPWKHRASDLSKCLFLQKSRENKWTKVQYGIFQYLQKYYNLKEQHLIITISKNKKILQISFCSRCLERNYILKWCIWRKCMSEYYISVVLKCSTKRFKPNKNYAHILKIT